MGRRHTVHRASGQVSDIPFVRILVQYGNIGTEKS